MLREIESKGERILNSNQLVELIVSLIQSVGEGLKIKIITGLWQGETLFLYGTGDVEAFLAREGKLARLCESWGAGSSVEGQLQAKDIVVLSTSEFVAGVGLAKIKEILLSDEEPAELLTPLVHTQTDSSGVAALIATVNPEKESHLWIPMKIVTSVPRKLNLWIGALILVLLIVMIGVGMVRRVKLVAERNIVELQSSVANKVAEVAAVGDLNPERARQLLTQSTQEVNTYLATEPKKEYKLQAERLLRTIAEAEERVFNKSEITLTTVTELSVLSAGLNAESMKGDGKGNVLLLDTQNKEVVSMHLADRSRRVIETTNENIVDIAVNETKQFGVEIGGVFEYFWDKKPAVKVIEADEFWKEPTQIDVFAGNIYVFDKAQSEIWKYPTLGATFGGRRRWLAAGITPDLSKVVDMKVVGDIWLLTSTGKLERYRQGAPVAFLMEGFPSQGEGKLLKGPTALWVTDSLVYVLESGAGRVVVFNVDGQYEAQYANSEFARASDLVIIDDKGYVLVDNAVKEFGL